MSKKLTATLVVNVLSALLLALNNKLGLNLPESVQVAVASGAAAVALWYLQKQGVVDAAKVASQPNNSISVHGVTEVHDTSPEGDTLQIKRRSK